MAFFLEAEGFLRAARPDIGVVRIPGRGGGGGGGPWEGGIPGCGGGGGGGGGPWEGGIPGCGGGGGGGGGPWEGGIPGCGGGGGGGGGGRGGAGKTASCTVSETGRTGGGTGAAGILHSGKTDRGVREGCDGGQGSGGGYCIHFFKQGLDGGVQVADRPAPENIERLADLIDQS